jgi:dTDP-4-dehydrorhamnose reductase
MRRVTLLEMRILITGAGGMLGHDLDVAARAAGHHTTALVRADLDVCDPAAARAAVADARADVVVNCAAWTDVDGAETDAEAAHAVNGAGAGAVAAAAAAAGAWTIHVSTDYVFDGAKRTPYLESDPVSPLSVYGASKLQGELAVAAAAPGAHTIVRTSGLFGAHGRCFPTTMLRLAAERDELRVVDDQIGCPTFTGHLAPALVGLASASASAAPVVAVATTTDFDSDVRPVGIMHVAAAGECSWCEFAQAIVAAGPDAGTTTVAPIPSTGFPTPASRPAYSVMRSARGAPQLPSWREGLADFLAARADAPAGPRAVTGR